MNIKDVSIEYERRMNSSARLTLTLVVDETAPGSAVAWAHELLETWSKAPVEEPMTATEVLRRRGKAAEVVPQENPSSAAPAVTEPSAPVAATAAPSTASSNPFAIGVPAQVVPAANPTVAPPKTAPNDVTPVPSSPTTGENSATSTAPAVSTSPPTTTTGTASETHPPGETPTGDAELTENDLQYASVQAVERKVKATDIKRITAKYANGSMSLRAIPQDKRAAWLKEVKELKAA
jgi:hypothetical protein